MSFLGIDGCRGGWCAAYIRNNDVTFLLESKIDYIIGPLQDIDSVLIDIPIGLGSKCVGRDLDQFARKTLNSGQKSSIFTPPLRETANAENYEDACIINSGISGKKISIQSWNISDKIFELENYLLGNPIIKSVIHESHPEICFKFLNFGKPLTYKKHAKGNLGIEERLKILSRFYPESYNVFKMQLELLNGHFAKPDDLVDALCLAITSKLGHKHGYEKIEGSAKKDDKNIDMYMYYFDPRKHEII